MTIDTERTLIGTAVIIIAVVLFVLLITITIPEGIKEPLLMSYGVFIAKFQTVIDYFFGSSKLPQTK